MKVVCGPHCRLKHKEYWLGILCLMYCPGKDCPFTSGNQTQRSVSMKKNVENGKAA